VHRLISRPITVVVDRRKDQFQAAADGFIRAAKAELPGQRTGSALMILSGLARVRSAPWLRV
jgi:hypothetical protein